MTKEELEQNLIDAGCSPDQVAAFEGLAKQQKTAEVLELLFCHRRELLRRMHQDQRRIDCLDYLVYQLRTQNAEREKGNDNAGKF